LASSLYAINKKIWLIRSIDVYDISRFSYLLSKLPSDVCIPENIVLEQMTNKDLNIIVGTLNGKLIQLNKEYEIKNCDAIIQDIAKC
jgi:hypothetical protein